MDGEPILKKTLVTVGAMVGACVAFVGTISVVAVLVVSHVVGPSAEGDAKRGERGDTNGPASVTTAAIPSLRAPRPDSPSSTPTHSTPRAHESI